MIFEDGLNLWVTRLMIHDPGDNEKRSEESSIIAID